MQLSEKKCKPCEGEEQPLSREETEEMLKQISGWKLLDEAKKISKEFEFNDFKEAMSFANKVADIAEIEGHHPDVFLSYGKVEVVLWTHAINGLSENDFILAAKLDKLK